MSTRTKFIIGVCLLLTVFVIAEYRMPRKFQWVPTFSHQDPQPFGCLAFDSVLAASMPMGYTVERRTLWQMEKDSVFTTPKAVMILSEDDMDYSLANVLQLARQGNIMLVATTGLWHWTDSLGIDYEYNNTFRLGDIAGKRPVKGRLRLVDNASQYGDALAELSVYQQLVERTLTIPDSVACQIFAEYSESPEDSLAPAVVAASFPIGEGELILVSAPLLLTNYGMLSGDGHLFIAHLMDHIMHLPVIRTESYMSGTAQTEQSLLYVLLKEPPLRWAIYLTMLTVVVFCFFTARRRQRVIPVIQQPQNANLEFVRLIGTLYWQQHDNAGLLAKKLAFTAEELRHQTGIDISLERGRPRPHGAADDSAGEDARAPRGVAAGAIQELAALTGRDPEELRLLLQNIHHAASGNYAVSDQELKVYIDQLDILIHNS